MQTMMTLKAEFGRSDGRKHSLRIKKFDSTKSAEEIKGSLTKLTKLNLFEKNGVRLFHELRHAKMIQETEKWIFEKNKAAKQPTQTQTAQMTPEHVEKPIEQVQVPDEKIENQEPIRIPEDLTITEEWATPNRLIQTIELPGGLRSWDISESYGFMMINACFPADVSIENIEADNDSVPAKLIITGTREEKAPKPEITAVANKESPPVKPKKKRRRLLDRIRKRE